MEKCCKYCEHLNCRHHCDYLARYVDDDDFCDTHFSPTTYRSRTEVLSDEDSTVEEKRFELDY